MSTIDFRGRDLLGIEDLTADEIRHILDAVPPFKEISERDIKKVPTLRGKTIINLFFEPSTRTRTSFEIAGKRLSADVINISVATSSVSKGETLRDTAENLHAMQADALVVHTVLIVGDIAASRVARSNILAMQKLNMHVCVCGPRTMLPMGIEQMGVEYTSDFDAAIQSADAVMMLRIQRERHGEVLFPSLQEYSERYCLSAERLRRAKSGVLVMHPGPMNRGVEIA